MGSPEPRRKRKRTARAHIHFNRRGGVFTRGRVSLPCFAMFFGLVMSVAVCLRKALGVSARRRAEELSTRTRNASAPLAVLLQEQHEIGSQAAGFADPAGKCLSSSSDDPPERLGPFTCLADARFFLRALQATLGSSSAVVLDVGSPSPLLPRPVGMVSVQELEMPEALHLQGNARIKVGEDPLPAYATLVLINAHEDLPADDWSTLILSLVKVLAVGGAIIIRCERGMQWTTGEEKGGNGQRDGSWHVGPHLRQAVSVLPCGETGVAAAVGNFDGGIVTVRHAGADESRLERGCIEEDGNASVDPFKRAAVVPEPLNFEKLFLWTTREAATVEAVHAKFGGADVVRRYALRPRDRLACVNKAVAGSKTSIEPLEKPGGGRLRGKGRKGAVSSSSPEFAARVCLENHLKIHTEDVRAAFALEMMLQAIGGIGVDRQVARLRERVCAESGPAGTLLWRALHSRAAGATARGLLP